MGYEVVPLSGQSLDVIVNVDPITTAGDVVPLQLHWVWTYSVEGVSPLTTEFTD